MTTVSDFMIETAAEHGKHMMEYRHVAARNAQRLGGFALLMAAIGLWFLPGSNWDADLSLMKLGVSTFLGFTGMLILPIGSEAD